MPLQDIFPCWSLNIPANGPGNHAQEGQTALTVTACLVQAKTEDCFESRHDLKPGLLIKTY